MDASKHPTQDARSKWSRAISRIEQYWDDLLDEGGAAGQFCISLSVLVLGILFVLALPWFVGVSLKRGIIG